MEQTKRTHIFLLTISDLRYEANIHRKVQTLVQAGYQVEMLCAYHPDLDLTPWQNIPLTRIKLPPRPTFWRFFVFIIKSFLRIIQKKADLFIAYDYLPLVPLRLKAFFKHCKYIYDSIELLVGLNSLVDRPWRQKFWRSYERLGLQKCSAAFTVCASDAKELQRMYPRLKVAGYVRNIPEYRSLPKSDFLRRKYAIPEENKIGIYQGMLFEGRGLREILTACKDIANLTLVFVGDGPLLNELKKISKSYGMDDRVIFTGLFPFRKLGQYTASADFGFTVISGKGLSYYHALPNKLFEYIQAELPVIGSNYPEIAAIVDKEKIGFAVDPHDVKGIQKAVREILREDIYAQFKERLKRIARKYTWREESKKYLQIIRSALFQAK